MIRLSQKKDPFDIKLPGGASIRVKPLDTPAFTTARMAAENEVQEVQSDQALQNELGFTAEEVTTPVVREGLYRYFLIIALGCRNIISWSGIGGEEGDETAPVTPENIRILFSDPVIAEAFYQRLIGGISLLEMAKKGSAAGANGTLNAAAAPITAEGAGKKTQPAPEESQA